MPPKVFLPKPVEKHKCGILEKGLSKQKSRINQSKHISKQTLV